MIVVPAVDEEPARRRTQTNNGFSLSLTLAAFDPHDISGFWMLPADGRKVAAAKLLPRITKAMLDLHARRDAHAIRWCNLPGAQFVTLGLALFTMIPLYLAALFSSYLATELIVTKFFTLSTGTYVHYFHLFLPPIDVVYSLIKAMVFAIVVTMIHCYYGYYASGGPAGVGVASGRAIRSSIVTVVIINLVLSIIFWGGGDTVRIAG